MKWVKKLKKIVTNSNQSVEAYIICNCLTCPCQGATVPQNRGQNGIYEGVWYNFKWEHISDSQKFGLLPVCMNTVERKCYCEKAK